MSRKSIITTAAFLFGLALFLAERGLDVSGIENDALAYSLWGAGGVLLVVALGLFVWGILSRYAEAGPGTGPDIDLTGDGNATAIPTGSGAAAAAARDSSAAVGEGATAQTMTNSPGGLQIGKIEKLTIQTEPEPEFTLSEPTYTALEDGHQYDAILSLKSRYAIPRLRVTAHAPSILSLMVAPRFGGVRMTLGEGAQEGFHFTILQDAAGEYQVVVVTAQSEEVKINLASS